jgi:TRAP-type C4-dicarboxylate transport system substrate-binding protein
MKDRRPAWQKTLERAAKKKLVEVLKSVEETKDTESTYLNVFNSGVIVHVQTAKKRLAAALRQYYDSRNSRQQQGDDLSQK